MGKELAKVENDSRLTSAEVMERVITTGDLAKLTPEDRVLYYNAVCESIGLNPLTKPFDYLSFNGRTVLYASKTCTDQLRKMHSVTPEIVSREFEPDLGLYIVTARATLPDGQCDEDVAAVNVTGLRGEALANAIMKCHTKAKRRVTLSICGLGWLDESERDSIPNAKPVVVDDDGVILEQPPVVPLPVSTAPVWEHVTDDQLKTLFALARKKGVTPKGLAQACQKTCSVESVDDLSSQQAELLIDMLTAKPDLPKPDEKTEPAETPAELPLDNAKPSRNAQTR